jgi:hypothetical protein
MFFKKTRTKKRLARMAAEMLVAEYPELDEGFVETVIYHLVAVNPELSNQYDVLLKAGEKPRLPDSERAAFMMAFIAENISTEPMTDAKNIEVIEAMQEYTADIRETSK